jgi:hypothetical protein
MRKDIAKVIVERPRTSRSFADSKNGTRRSKEWKNLDAPTKLSMKPYRGGKDKYSTDFLAPLNGLVRRSVGRPWDKVFAEISEHLKPSSTMQQHVLDHAKHDLLETNVDYDVNGHPWSKRYTARPLRPDELYVDVNGFIRRVKNNWKYKRAEEASDAYWRARWGSRYGEKTQKEPSFKRDGVEYHRENGIWYRREFVEERTDTFVRVDGTKETKSYPVYRSRQLNKKELKQLELKNELPLLDINRR